MQNFLNPQILKDLNSPPGDISGLFEPGQAIGQSQAPGQSQKLTPPSFMNPQVVDGLPQAEVTPRIFAYLLEEPRPKTPVAPPAPPTPNSVSNQKITQFSPKDANGTKATLKTLESKQFGFSQSAGLDSLLQSTKPAKPTSPPPGQESNTAPEQGGQPVFTFLVNPQALEFRRRAVYSDAVTAATSIPAQQYYHTTGRELQISNLLMETWFLRRSLRPILERLQWLLVPDIPNESLAPKVLSFVWGSQTFGPCVLTDINWKEKSWLNGEPATIELSMSLLEIPPPDGDMVSRWVGEKKKITGLGEGQNQTETGGGESTSKTSSSKDSKGKPKKQPVLTDRQTQDASKKAEDWLNSNRTKLDPQVQQRLKSNNYQLQVDPNTGRVTMLNGVGGEKIGTVGNWDGQQFDTTKNTIKKAKQPKQTGRRPN